MLHVFVFIDVLLLMKWPSMGFPLYILMLWRGLSKPGSRLHGNQTACHVSRNVLANGAICDVLYLKIGSRHPAESLIMLLVLMIYLESLGNSLSLNGIHQLRESAAMQPMEINPAAVERDQTDPPPFSTLELTKIQERWLSYVQNCDHRDVQCHICSPEWGSARAQCVKCERSVPVAQLWLFYAEGLQRPS